ncbi:MAG TPA: PAS domain-containing protein [Deltaproteobacteria bacterium]|nr:PAS domain-containing protein [Deltaproteobacteria bacterium]HIJ40538.1 PAS domain-containing protein [Deltaproteobacteria bacterium]
MKEELSREEYKLLVEKAPIMIWRSTVTMECDYFNEIWLSFTGRSMEQEVGDGWVEGVHPEDFEKCLKTYTDNFAMRKVFEMEYRLRRFDGVYRWIFDRGTPYSDSDGNFKGYIGSCIDVTERVDAQKALRKVQEAEIKQLRGFLPICSYCKQIRDDKGYWNQIESYISEHTETLFSHGICPDCAKKLYPEFDLYPETK